MRKPKRGLLGRIVRWVIALVLICYGFALLGLVALRWVDPLSTAVQAERRVESWNDKADYQKRYTFVPLDRISRDFQHAVIAAEDSRFFQHHGFDWVEIKNVIVDDLDGGRLRGASTITQQLIKNLFLTTSGSIVRKGIEATLVPPTEWILPKRRILELYLNVIEWGPGVYGAEAAAQHHYGTSASRITREQGARLAAILPSPRRRKPAQMGEQSGRILARMSKMGW